MTPLNEFAKNLAKETRTFVFEQMAPLKERITILEAENKALTTLVESLAQSTKGALRFRDTWSSTAVYAPGDVCVWRGSAWAAIADSVGYAPGQGTDGRWRLLVSRGRDGKDARSAA